MIRPNEITALIGRPVGISFRDGRGTSGVLCDVGKNEVYILEYLYQKQFATKHYNFNEIDDINGFPPCGNNRPPRPLY
jgi:hypothetical protein